MSFKKNILLIVCLFIAFSLCAQEVKQDDLTSFSQEELIQIALKETAVQKSNTDFITAKVSPNNSNETIVVIPEVVNKEEDMYELSCHIVIINNKTGNVSHKFFESSKETGWFSDAIYIADISVDTKKYRLSPTHEAFGVVIQYIGSSQPNPYGRKDISIYTKKGTSLKKMIDSFTLHEESGEVNVNINACYSDIKKTVNELSITTSKTNGYYDFLVMSTNSQLVSFKDKNNDCEVKEKSFSVKKELLTFNGIKYQK